MAPASALGKRLIIDGSTSVLPLAQKLATAYHRRPTSPRPKVGGGQSDVGISEPPRPRRHRRFLAQPDPGVDPKGLIFTKIARDGVCVITNTNPIRNLSQQLIEGIFTGAIRDWSEVPGAKSPGRSTCRP